MSAASSLRQRLTATLRSRRLRSIALLFGGYKAYTTYNTYNILNKPFSSDRHRPGLTILDLDLDAMQIVSEERYSMFGSAEEIRLHNLISTIDDAKHDPRVAGLVVRGLGGLRGLGLADVDELRQVISDFSSGWGGKQTMLHVPQGLGGAGNGTVPMYFASAFDSVHVQPTSGVVIPGLSAATLFFKRMLDQIGVKMKKVARKEFKTAVNSITEEKFTDPHRESTEALLKAVMDAIIKGTAEGRDIEERNVRDAIDLALMSSSEAQELGIIDEPLYRDELPKAMRERLRVAEQARSDARVEAEQEWREAMKELRRVWEEGGSLDMWGDGDVLQNLAQYESATVVALSFVDTSEKWKKEATEAELRALKAHLRWLDTCPWEAVIGTDEEHLSAYKRATNISAVLNTERRLCVDAIQALEECPPLIENLRKQAKDKEMVLNFNEDKSISLLRRGRSIWRAKCLVARMVGTLLDTEDALKRAMANGSIPEEAAGASVDRFFVEPRVFLTGFRDDLRGAVSFERIQEIPDGAEVTAEASEVGELDYSEEGKGQVGQNPTMISKKNLRHMRFADYVDLLQAENRAAMDRAGGFIRLESRDPYLKLPGAVDYAERQALMRLQLPGYRFAPWRFGVPKGGIIAVITVEGAISDDTADITRSALRRADKDPQIKGIVLRIDSPGGSATASDLISRAVEVAKKPVVASMGDVCASGGYFISAPCDKVFASNVTITGSIGVIFSALNTAGLFEKVGITSDSVESGRFSKYFGAQSSIAEWSEDFAKRVDALIDNFYGDFVKAVARGRNMEFEQAEKIARGRVWAGSDALSLGLVDEIGGLEDAVQAAAELANLPPDGKTRAINYPTVAMQVQDAARRRGLMPSNLDEEGDESMPERKRRWFLSRNSQDSEQTPSPDMEPAREPVPAAILPTISADYTNVYHFVVSSLLGAFDRILLSSSSSTASHVVELLLSRVIDTLEPKGASSAVRDEIKRTHATAGRPAAIAPHIRLDD